VPCGQDRVPDVMLVRRRHVDDLDRRIGAERLDGLVGVGGEVRREPRARLGPRVGRRHQGDPRIGRECRQHDRERAAEPHDPDPQLALSDHHCLTRAVSLE
jgi:hypothetical protein